MKYGLNSFLEIADSYVNADVSTVNGIEKRLMSWYCFKFNTHLKDSTLQELTVEELLVLYQMYRLKDNPDLPIQQEDEEYEEWLKKEMGSAYLTDEKMIEGMEIEEKEYTEKIKAQFPEKIMTNFNQLKQDD